MALTPVGVQIGADGVNDYKKHLDAATAATKAFKAELDLAGKIQNPFEKYAAQAGALDGEIAAQVQRVSGLQIAYEKAVQQYGAYSKEAFKAQENLAKANTALSAMMDQYKGLSGTKIELPGIGEFKRDLDSLSQASKTFQAEFRTFSSGFGLGDSFKKAADMSDSLKNSITAQEEVIKLLGEDYARAVQEQGEFSEGAMKLREKVANATTELNEMRSTLKDLPNGLQLAGQEMKDLGGKWQGVGKEFTDAAKPFNVFTGVYTAGIAGMAKSTMDYERQMSVVQAVSGKTTDEMSNLNDILMKMAGDSIYAPLELAEGLEVLGRAGIKDTNDQIAVLEAGLHLATAEGENFGTMADGLVNVLYMYGMSAGDAGQAADILAQASRSANTNVTYMYDTLKYAGPSMAALGYSLADTALAADLMADNGVRAGQAGTALRQAFKNLEAPTDTVKNAMEKFNISLDDGKGNAVPFADLLGQLRTSFGDLDVAVLGANGELRDGDELFEELGNSLPVSQLEKLQGIVDIFGTRALPGMLAMINASPERFEELTAAMDNASGTAEEMSKIVEESAGAQWEKLINDVQALAIEFGQTFLPVIKDVLDVAKGWVDKFRDMDDGTKKFLLTAGGIIATIGPVLTGIGGITSGIGGIIKTGGHLSSGIGGIAKLIGGSGGGGLIGGIGGLITKLGPLLPGGMLITGLIAGGVLLYKNWDTIKEKAGELGTKISEAWTGFKEKTVETFTSVKDSISETVENIKTGVSEKWNDIKETITNSKIGQAAGQVWGSVKDTVTGKLQDIRDAYDAHGGGLEGAVFAGMETIKGKYTAGYDFIDNLTNGKLSDVAEATKTKLGDAATATREKFESMKSSATEKIKAMSDKVKSDFNTMKTNIANAWSAAKNNASNVVGNMVSTIRNKLSSTISNAWSWGKDIASNIANGLSSAWQKVKNAASNIAGVIRSYLHFSVPDKGPLADADTYMPDFIQLLSKGMNDGVKQLSRSSFALADSIAFTPTHYASLPAGGVTNNMGGVNITINAQPGQDANEIAEAVEERISALMGRREAVFA